MHNKVDQSRDMPCPALLPPFPLRFVVDQMLCEVRHRSIATRQGRGSMGHPLVLHEETLKGLCVALVRAMLSCPPFMETIPSGEARDAEAGQGHLLSQSRKNE